MHVMAWTAAAITPPLPTVKLGIRGNACLMTPILYNKGCGSQRLNAAKNTRTVCLNADRDSSKARVCVDSNACVPLVKMCGITSVHDAVVAAEAGANFIGMILWPKSKRSVPLDVAKEISRAAREYGAEPVGVFVDEDADEIERACDATNIAFVQLHGNGARNALSRLIQHRNIIYVLHVDKGGKVLTKNPNEESSVLVDWILIDSLGGGNGQKFDWENLQVPVNSSKNGWLLAGGINPQNVSEAISILRPDVVDVSSGICASDGIQKDPSRITSFIHAVRQKR
uniref:phosphoribosylanthranilate isomerase n=1 Tax=Araucaria cunninghamii TaxID=56994 RepID=A0A0D6QY55_ARACU